MTSRAQYDQVMQASGEWEERAERGCDEDYDRWKDARAFERADEEAIANMFDSLR